MIGERHPESPVVRIVHEFERLPCKNPLQQVVFDKDAGSGDSCRLLKQEERILGMVKHIDEHAKIERTGREWNRPPVERSHRNHGVMSNKCIYSSYLDVLLCFHQESCHGTVPASDVQKRGFPFRQKSREFFVQNPGPPGPYETLMKFSKCHRESG